MDTPYLDRLIKEREEYLKDGALFGQDKIGLIELKKIKQHFSNTNSLTQKKRIKKIKDILTDFMYNEITFDEAMSKMLLV